jgi:MbtH protein
MTESEAPVYQVVVNHEEQYSICPAGRELPVGWIADGTTGPKKMCLTRIEEV